LASGLSKHAENTAQNHTENLVFDFEKEQAIKAISKMLKKMPKEYCLSLAERIRNRIDSGGDDE